MNEIEQKAVRKDGDVTMCDLLNKEIEELTNQKEIEEMARCIAFELCPKRHAHANWGEKAQCYSDNNFTECKQIKNVVDKLYNAGYRNCKDKVVLSKEEYEKYEELTYPAMFEASSLVKENDELRDKCGYWADLYYKTTTELKQASELKAETIKLEQQSTARDIINYVRYSFIHNRREFLKDLEELEKEYGVEVE